MTGFKTPKVCLTPDTTSGYDAYPSAPFLTQARRRPLGLHLSTWLLVTMVAWSIFAVGGVYVWAGLPLIAGGLLIAVSVRPRIGASAETRLLDRTLQVGVATVVLQLVPLPERLRAAVSPHADEVRRVLSLVPQATSGWHPVSLAPAWTAYGFALLATAALVFWACREACARGGTRSIVRAVAVIGLLAAIAAIVQQAGDPALVYGLWRPQEQGARPFGPFVNRNHFATWVLMAIPLVAGYVAASISAYSPSRRLSEDIAMLLRGIGSSTAWVAIAGAVMLLGLLASASRSGLIALVLSLGSGIWIGRRRLNRPTRIWGIVALALLAAFLAAYADLRPLLSRVEETLAVGALGRPGVWEETRRVVRDFWLSGTGLGSYQTAMLVYQQTDRTMFVNQAHSQYLQLLAEGGLLLVVSAAVALAAFVRLFRARLAKDTSPSAWLRVGSATALLAVAVQSCWETGLRMPANGILFAIVAAIAVHRPAEELERMRRG